MGQLIELKINVAKINKEKLFIGKDGAAYLTLTVSVNDDVDKFGNDVSSYEQQTEEERKEKKDRNYLGNGKTFWAKGAKTAAEKAGGSGSAPAADSGKPPIPDLPF